ncbi:glycosyltransferase [uncultured Amnibacterium sp.]|uniref:glycosyltransferase n=1 Tax=uncultured Amnibacterium sp. TaxID=1631851 RepID=UPI0035CBE716
MTAAAADGAGAVLVHEWVTRAGGSENVFHSLGRIYPSADVVCLWNDDPDRFPRERTHESWLARTPLRGRKALALPLMPLVWRTLPQGPYDWAILSSHAFAHHARFGRSRDAQRFVYVHSPARYLWTPEVDARGANPLIRIAAAALRPIDRRRAHEGAVFAANSAYVRQRIADTWGVDSTVIHPPVAVEAIRAVDDWADELTGEEARALASLPDQFVLGASRFIPYKRLDLVIDAGALAGLPVVLAGAGDLEAPLREKGAGAGVPVTFVIRPSSAMLRALFQRCAVYVFPAVEDFGIMPVEALAAGAAVVAQAVGGTAEIIQEGTSGALTTFRSPADVGRAIEIAVATTKSDRLARADTFSEAAFERQIRAWTSR